MLIVNLSPKIVDEQTISNYKREIKGSLMGYFFSGDSWLTSKEIAKPLPEQKLCFPKRKLKQPSMSFNFTQILPLLIILSILQQKPKRIL